MSKQILFLLGRVFLIWFLLAVCRESYAQSAPVKDGEHKATSEMTRPWTRWWWMGNAVDREGITANLSALKKAGIGGVEITPIYGVKGEESHFISHLSDRWTAMLEHTLDVADSLGMGVDMVLGTGWPYGGPQVSPEYAAGKLGVSEYHLRPGESMDRNLQKEYGPGSVNAVLQYVFAFRGDGEFENITADVKGGRLQWQAGTSPCTIYAVFCDKTGQKVKRAAPGGEGFTLDHYSGNAFKHYVNPYDKALKGLHGRLRAFFNDSYEVYGTDYTPDLFEYFRKKRGYDLARVLPLLLDTLSSEAGNRVKSDYRETISDMLLENFVRQWTAWSHEKGSKSKLQAHGSPGNLIDLYAAADIPECETFGSMPFDIPGFRREASDIREGDADRMMLKFASSAAHIAGKPLVSSESFTWLREHFKTALSQCKPEVEELFLAGVNHTFLHGTTYAPERAQWPGWKFYASVNFHPNNTIWEDAPGLFSYIDRVQSVLQTGQPGRDVLLYWPIYDTWGKNLGGTRFFQFKIHSLEEWLYGTSFYEMANLLLDGGYAVDFISDRYILQAGNENGSIKLPGGNYKAIVVPDSDKMPLETLKKLLELKDKGAKVIFAGLPGSVPGFHRYKQQNRQMGELLAQHSITTITGGNLLETLERSGVSGEPLAASGIKYLKRVKGDESYYYLVNHQDKAIDEWLPLRTRAKGAELTDPLTGGSGRVKVLQEGDLVKVRVQLEPGQSLLVHLMPRLPEGEEWTYYKKDASFAVKGMWEISFLRGGPVLPEPVKAENTGSWTDYGENYEAFSGTARYTVLFDRPTGRAENWQLQLGDVRESAKVWLNGKYLGSAWSVPYVLETGKLRKRNNKLEIEVTNLSANRIRDMELKGEEWKIFYDANIVDRNYKKFDATGWEPMPSGLLGQVKLVALVRDDK
ncbi:glycosyl hydrolase [Sinomicrobium soli]|uniref:glycosyl hydrolase n=1 Tax=Sinomicrobium sp. N-1-3-6 TaxID=2219864 RepID=UPI000DCB50CD|nr:glycosyl hydrolase [Sinomicrobium sp. N-1-3-6]RAV28137.1 glycoside hydrolase [Sinomicrobium sp. N-1-3-6]